MSSTQFIYQRQVDKVRHYEWQIGGVTNPAGHLDINFSNGRITLQGEEKTDGSRVDYFIQPSALSFGQIISTPTDRPDIRVVNVSTIDIDVLGKNWASLKVSQSIGTSTSKTYTLPTGETIEASGSIW